MRRRVLVTSWLREPREGWPFFLVVVAVIAVGLVLGVVGNKGAELLPKSTVWQVVVAAVVLVLLVSGLTVLQNRLGARSASTAVDPRNRAPLLDLVRARAAGQVNQALHRVVPLELGLHTRPDVVEFPNDLIVHRLGGATSQPVPRGQPIEVTFNQLNQAMLLMGAPGAGKTTLLNQLAVALADRAVGGPPHRIPVVLNLASWASRQPPLQDWLTDELNVVYRVHPKLGARMVAAGWLLPLLDGLDEVPAESRSACAKAINDYQAARGEAEGQLAPLVVCSRLAEAEALAVQLRLAGAVTLEPPSDQLVIAYLEAVGAADVVAALQADPTLWELLRSPLTLSIVALTRTDGRQAALHEPAETRMGSLLDAYVTTLLTPSDPSQPHHTARRRTALAPWPPQRTRAWLAWLAGSMTNHGLSELYLERLQPTWLVSQPLRRIVLNSPWLVGGLVGALGGVVGTITGGTFISGWMGRVPDTFGLMASNVLIGTIVGAIIGIAFTGLVARAPQIQPAETLKWSWFDALAGGLPLGAGAVLFALLGLGALISGIEDRMKSAPYITAFALLIGLLVHGFRPGIAKTATKPNEGIRRSIRNALLGGLVGVLGCGLIISSDLFLGTDFLPNPRARVVFLATMGGFGLMSGAGGTAVIQHYVLRLMLTSVGATPGAYVRFLEAAVDGLLLRRVGGGFRFPHRLLQERFATYSPAAPVVPARDSTGASLAQPANRDEPVP
jgi:energy-coupling factor transporter ATP-binding protein EcfA2